MVRRHVSEQELFQQLEEGIYRQRVAREAGQLRDPDDVDLDFGRGPLTSLLRTEIAAWVSSLPPQDDLKAWQGVIADELMFLAAEMFAMAHRDDDDGELAFEVNQFVGTLETAIDECRTYLRKRAAQR